MRNTHPTNSGAVVSECLDLIREGDPAAAPTLYRLYAEQVRMYLRRHTGIRDVEDTVFSILLEAIRSIRNSGSASLDDLSQTVRELSQQGVFALRRTRPREATEPTPVQHDRRREMVNTVFTVLDYREREILLRSSLLSERDEEISDQLALPILQVRRTRAKAQVLLRISSQIGACDARAV